MKCPLVFGSLKKILTADLVFAFVDYCYEFWDVDMKILGRYLDNLSLMIVLSLDLSEHY